MQQPSPKKGEALAGWALATFACLVAAFYAFATWAPWVSAMTPERAEERFPGRIDPTWRAVVANRGVPIEWTLGTPAENPAGLALTVVASAAAFAGFLYCLLRATAAARAR